MKNQNRNLFSNRQSLPESLTGQIERVTFFNQDNGYCVIKISIDGYRDPITAVGNLMNPRPGEMVQLKGIWLDHPKFGRQFKISEHKPVVPVTIQGIRKYLGSGMIKGIGPKMAERIVDCFGDDTLNIIDFHIDELGTIEGIGRKRIEMIDKAWQEQKEIRGVMIFLQEHGISAGYAAKIYKRYGMNAISVVSGNPFKLATDIIGIGFQKADTIAAGMGFAKETPARIEAGILFLLNRLSEEGHIYYPYEALIVKSKELLEVERDLVIKGISALSLEGKAVIEDLNLNLDTFIENNKAVYLKRFHLAETGTAFHLGRLINSDKTIREIEIPKAIKWVQNQINIKLAPKQIEALEKAIQEKTLVITGGPGTGKTTIIQAVIKIFSAVGAGILLAAPTGRASRRMSETTGHQAKTIHRLLEYNFKKGGFQKNEQNPLDGDIVILDEVSMIDTLLMSHFLRALRSDTILIMVGDGNQLPSVGAGNTLRDIIKSGAVEVVELKEIFRQAGGSRIIVNAHRIIKGIVPEMERGGKEISDYFFIEQDDPDQVLAIILELITDRIPNRFKLDPLEEIQLLSPMHKGNIGIGNLNNRLQEALNPNPPLINRGGVSFRLNDKVIQMRNNYEKDVFNGDIGRIETIDLESQELFIAFEGRDPVSYEYSDLEEISLAYAISVHKSQGSEYPAVVVPVLTQHYVLLQRNLIYTALTRGKKLVVLVGSKKAMAIAVNNNSVKERYSFLYERLKR